MFFRLDFHANEMTPRFIARTLLDPIDKKLSALTVVIKNRSAAMLNILGRFQKDEALFRIRQIDPSSLKLSNDRFEIGLWIASIQREFKSTASNRRTVACTGVTSMLGEHRDEVVAKVHRFLRRSFRPDC